MYGDQELCPNCGNHCPQDNLKCGRGRAYFEGKQAQENNTDKKEESSLKNNESVGGRARHFSRGRERGLLYGSKEEKGVIAKLCQCGHLLPHGGANITDEVLCRGLTEEERTTLEELLTKVLKNIK